MSALLTDLRYSWRALLRRPLFALTAVLTLGIAIGGNLLIGSMLYSRFLAPLPYPGAERMVVLTTQLPKIGIDDGGVPAFDYERWRQAEAIEASTVYDEFEPVLVRGASAERVEAVRVMPDAFALLGVQPALGQVFEAGDEDAVLLSHAVWQRDYAGDPRVLGTTLRLDGRPRVVRGVLPAAFVLPDTEADYLLPMRFEAAELAARVWKNSFVLLRLRAGASMDLAATQIAALEQAYRAQGTADADFYAVTGFEPRLLPLREKLHGDLRPALVLLQWAVLGVLLLACANVAHLQLLRASQRRSELGLRQALGANRVRLARLVFSESLLVAALGAGLGLLLAAAGSQALASLAAFEGDAQMPWATVLSGALVLCGACALLCALPAMFGFRRTGTLALRPGNRVAGAAQAMPRVRHALVVAQTALTVVLLIGAGLLLRSFSHIVDLDPGFHRAGVLTAALEIDDTRYEDPAQWVALRDRIVEAVGALPGVRLASFTDSLPFGQSYSLTNYAIDGEPAPAMDAAPVAVTNHATDDYFEALGIPLLQGRLFRPEDAGQRNVIVDARFVQRHFPDGNAIGKRITFGGNEEERQPQTIVGVVGTVTQLSLEEKDMQPSVYRPYAALEKSGTFLVLRSDLPLSGLVAPLRETLRRIDPEHPPRDIRPLAARIDDTLEDRRSPLFLLGLFAAVALALAAIGQYGLMAWSVAQRENELGLRMAIGAQRRDILLLVLRGGVQLTVLGLAAGVVLAAVASRWMASQLYGVGALDPLTYVAVAGLLGVVALTACVVPALRAVRIAPAVALRGE